MKQFVFIAFLLVSTTLSSNAQGFFQVHIGAAIPSGDFADDDYDNALYSSSGYASNGLNLGIIYYSPLKREGLSFVLSMNLFYNKLDKDFRNEYEDDYDDYDVSFPMYINLPVLTGLSYNIPLKEKLAIFGEGSIGVNMLKVTNLKREGGSGGSSFYNKIITEKFSPSIQLGYTIGGGVLIQDKYRVGLNYNGLGSHKSKYNRHVVYTDTFDTQKNNYEFNKALDIRLISLTLGIKI